MEIRFTRSFGKDYRELPSAVQKAVDTKLALLLKNPRHPSLRVKKMEGYRGVWEVRVTLGYRLTFSVFHDAYVIRRAGPHDILKNP